VNRAGVLFRRLDRGQRPSSGPLIGDDLLQALDAVLGEGGYTVLTDTIDPQQPSSGKQPRSVPGQRFVEPVERVLSDAGEDVGQPRLRIDVVHFGRDDDAACDNRIMNPDR
jgi:hypothetical protein